MEHVRLGGSGLKVSRVCLGTMTFGIQSDEATAWKILDAAAEFGVSFIDTADIYPLAGSLETVGTTERIVGEWLRGRRDQFVVATKCVGPMGPHPWQAGASRRHILEAIDASLSRLGTDYVDLYQLHFYDADTPLDETIGALEEVVASGKARYIGCSNFMAHQIARMIGKCEARRFLAPVSTQVRYNPVFRQFERDLLPMCLEERVGVLAYNTLAGGLLTGKHRNGPAPGSRYILDGAAERYRDRYWNTPVLSAVNRLRELARRAGLSMTTMSIAWVLSRPAITSIVGGASRPEQLDDIVAALGWSLEATLIAAIDEITDQFRTGDALR